MLRRKLIAAPFVLALTALACEWDPAHPLERYAPSVDQAIAVLDAGDAAAAAAVLSEYLDSNQCNEGQIAISAALREKQRAGLDLGLVLFRLAESYGKRLTEDDGSERGQPSPEQAAQVTCALAVARELADQGSIEDRARAAFVEGNLLFLNGAYEDAVPAYDRALTLLPPAEGDDTSMSADAAFNRALALARAKDQPDAGDDGGDPNDGGGDSGENDAESNDAASDGGGEGENDASSSNDEPDSGDSNDAGSPPPQDEDAGSGDDAGAPPQSPPPEEDLSDGGAMPPPEALDRLLDDLERTPTVQQELLNRDGRRRRIRPEDDK